MGTKGTLSGKTNYKFKFGIWQLQIAEKTFWMTNSTDDKQVIYKIRKICRKLKKLWRY